ncbi:MAG: SAM-dependent methyltransferase [Planctomycetota bacterium]|jgi:SAM-dependent methyltransferase
MNSATTHSSSESETPWFESAFEAGYLDVYAHRSQDAARAEVAGLLERQLVPAGGCLLDLACGAGRHTLAFLEAGCAVVGLDLSGALLARAQELDGGILRDRLVRGDVRALPFRTGAFDTVAMLFSSWGYFDDDANAEVLEVVARSVAPGGLLLLDLMNADRIRRTLVPESRDEKGGRVMVQRRHLGHHGRRVVKHVSVTEADGTERTWHEDVRLYGPNELEVLLLARGFRLERLEGDFDGRPFDADAPRMIVWARRNETQ